jgi:hypothetical protein
LVILGPDFPPLLAVGWHPMSLPELRRLCVDPFPSSVTRDAIMGGLEVVAARLIQSRVVGDLWIDGSFLTEKINPKDSDVALCIDSPSMFEFGSLEQRETIKWINGNLKIPLCFANHMWYLLILSFIVYGRKENGGRYGITNSSASIEKMILRVLQLFPY